MINYAKDLETKAAKIEQRVQNDFVLTDWDLNGASKIWTNEKFNLKIQLEKGQSQTISFLKERLVQYYVENQLPNASSIDASLNDLVNAKVALLTLMKREYEQEKQNRLVSIKKQRLENLYDYQGPKRLAPTLKVVIS